MALRYTTVYGERQHYRAANALYIIETLEKLAKGERPVILGDGTDTKHYVYAGDLAVKNALEEGRSAQNIDPELITQKLTQLDQAGLGQRIGLNAKGLTAQAATRLEPPSDQGL